MKVGRLRTRVEDFFVDEVVPPRTAQEGEHLHIRIEKRGISTEEAVRRLAGALGVSPKLVGRCGRKDVRAVTRQWLSFTGVSEDQMGALELPDLHVLEFVRLPRKLRLGRFLGNRFRIRVRDLDEAQIRGACERLEQVAQRGLRNRFGEQRLGPKDLNARIGQHLIQGRIGEALALQVQASRGRDTERMQHHLEAGREEKALAILGRRRAGFLVSAWQSKVFNSLLQARDETYDQALEGDLLQQHSSGRLVSIEDHQRATEGVARFEYSPTGPLPGPKMKQVTGAALALEQPLLEAELPAEQGQPLSLERRGWFGCMGARRPLRVPVTETAAASGVDDLGSYLELAFRLPPGAFATTLLEEILLEESLG